MKKTLSLLLALVLCLSLCACGETETTVEIAMENWDNFFEFKEIELWHENSFGEIDGLEIMPVICVREEYVDRIILQKTQVAVEYSTMYTPYYIKIDFENKTYEWGNDYSPESEDAHTAFTSDCMLFTEYTDEELHTVSSVDGSMLLKDTIFEDEYGQNYATRRITTITRIQGTIVVKGEVPEGHIVGKSNYKH